MTHTRTGSRYMILSAVMLSIVSMLGKLGGESMSLPLLIFLRFGLGLLLFLPFLYGLGYFKYLFDKPHLMRQLARCSLVLLSQYSLFYYLMDGTLLNAAVLQSLGPLLIPILDGMIFKQRIQPVMWVLAGISFVGMLCVLQPVRGFVGEVGFVGMLIPLGQAGSQVLYGHQAKVEKNEVSLFYLLLLSTVVSGLMYLCFNFVETQPPISREAPLPLFGILIALGAATVLNQFFRGIAYKHGRPSQLAPLLYTTLLFSALIDWIFFHRIPNMLSIFGSVLVLISGGFSIHLLRRKTPQI